MTTKKSRVVVFDDEQERREEWAKRLRKRKPLRDLFDFKIVSLDDFKAGIEALERRRDSARRRSSVPNDETEEKARRVFDYADVLVLDYDLFAPERAISRTGEEIAYLARCYSKCGIIVALNQFVRGGKIVFDLTLRGHPESFADVNIGDADLDNEGLWIEPENGFRGFRPWYWPLISTAIVKFRHRCEELRENLDKSIFEHLSLKRAEYSLSRNAVEFIEYGLRNPSETTFRQFVENSGNALHPKDRALDDDSVARIAAARISAWLENMIIPSQDVLIDAPHLVARYPSLIRGERSSIKSWNAVVKLTSPPEGMDTGKIEPHRFKHDAWVSRPVWFWNEVSESKYIEEVRDPFAITDSPDFVFCEDLSRFMQRKFAKDFIADVPGPYDRRFVVSENAKLTKAEKETIAKVEYEPKVRFLI